MSSSIQNTAPVSHSNNSNLSFDVSGMNAAITLFTDKNSKQIQDIITQTMAYPMEKIVTRYMIDNNISAELAATHERELKRFLAICIIYQEPIGMRGAVDELWHTFIMFTKNYASFCNKIAGYFIHHTPNDEDTTKSERYTSSIRFNLAYEKLFNTAPPEDVWPKLSENCEEICGKGCVSRCG